MPAQATIADGVIKIALQGLQAAKEQLKNLQSQTKQLADGLGRVGSASAAGFATATGSITGFLRVADPVRFEIFSQKLLITSYYIGRIFVPALVEAINYLDRLIDFLRHLSPEQEAQIRHWVGIGTAVLGAGAALGALVTVGTKVATVIRGLGLAISALTSSTGVGLVLVLAAAAFGVYELLKATGKLDPIIERLTEVFNSFDLTPFLDMLKGLVDQLAPVFQQVVGIVSGALAEIMPILQSAASDMLRAFLEVVPSLVSLLRSVVRIVVQLLPFVAQLAAVLVRVYAAIQVAQWKLLAGILGVVAKVLSALAPMVEALANGFQEFAPILTELGQLFDEIVSLGGELLGALLEPLAEVLGELAGLLADVAKEFWAAFGDDIRNFIKGVADFIRGIVAGVRALVAAVKEAKQLVSGGSRPNGQQGQPSTGSRLGGAATGSVIGGIFGGPLGSLVGGYIGSRVGGGSSTAQQPAPAPAAASNSGMSAMFRDMMQVPGRAAAEATRPNWSAGMIRNVTESITRAVSDGAGRVNPLPVQKRNEFFGIEDAFKRAQQGAIMDPSKLLERERWADQQRQTGLLGRIADNTERETGAGAMRAA